MCLSYCKTTFRFEITNIVGCRPWKVGRFGKISNRTPTQKEKEACLPRLHQLVEEIEYDRIIYLGAEAKDFKAKGKVSSSLSLLHPAAILRKEYKLYYIKEFALKLDNYVSAYCETRG